MVPYNAPRRFSYDSYQPSYAQYPRANKSPNNSPSKNECINDGNMNGHANTNSGSNSNTNGKNRSKHVDNNVFGMNFGPIIYYPENNQSSATTRNKHKKSKSLPKTQFPLINKFQSSLYQGPTKANGGSHVQLTNKVNFPVHQQTCDASPEKTTSLKAIYPQIETKKYSTSAIDTFRNYVTVFEYSINKHWIIWDYETGFVHLTGIWKASINDEINTHRNLKADIVKLLESTPKQYHHHIKRIRGGFLKIQGTWLPFDLCKMLAKRFCYHIRFELIPIFGNGFPQECLTPEDKGFGELKLDEYMEDPTAENVIKQGKKSHRIVKRRSASLLESPIIKRASSVSHLSIPSTNHFASVNPTPFENTPQRLPQFSFPQTAGLVNQKFQYQEHTPQYALSSMHNSFHTPKASSFSMPQNNSGPLPISHTSLLQIPYTSNIHILSNSQQSLSLHHSPSYFHQTPQNNFSTSYHTPQHSLPTSIDTRQITEHRYQSTPSSEMSYHDMIDLVNASKCLQSLSQTQVSPISHESVSNRDYITSVPKTPSCINSSGDGISSILLAAGVREESHNLPNHTRRISMRINDILS